MSQPPRARWNDLAAQALGVDPAKRPAFGDAGAVTVMLERAGFGWFRLDGGTILGFKGGHGYTFPPRRIEGSIAYVLDGVVSAVKTEAGKFKW